MNRYVSVSFLIILAIASPAAAHDILRIYGPGGPAPAMKEAAKAFTAASGIPVEVTAGPAGEWMPKAKKNADLIFSGSENMMTAFVRQMDGALLEPTIRPLYIRPSSILVRPGNPKKIAGVADLLKPGMKILVVEGAGQIGLWEDIAGRLGDLETVRRFRRNIVAFPENSGVARTKWTSDPSIDAWLIWNIWDVASPDIADTVDVEPELRIWRDCGIGLTKRGSAKAYAADFVEFLESDAGRAIFTKWGWK